LAAYASGSGGHYGSLNAAICPMTVILHDRSDQYGTPAKSRQIAVLPYGPGGTRGDHRYGQPFPQGADGGVRGELRLKRASIRRVPVAYDLLYFAAEHW